jgi:transposase
METRIKEIVDQARKTYGSVEVKRIKDNFYLYKVTRIRDPTKKWPKKITGEYIGKITSQGLIAAKTRERTIYEYANAQLLSNILEEITPQLSKHFPDEWRELSALAIVRTIRNVPIKYIKDAWEKLYPSTKLEAHLSRNTVSELLKAVGADWDAQSQFFTSLIKGNSIFYFDLSSIFSRSVNLNLAEKGYSKEHLFIDQINFALLFSQEQKTPVMLKSMPGSIRDVKSLSYIMEEFPLKNCIVILDRGFFSKSNVDGLLSLGASFIQPLRRNSKLIDYKIKPNQPFAYRERGITFAVKDVKMGDGKLRLFLYEDVLLRGEEHSNLIKLHVKNESRRLVVDESRLGKVSVLTNLDWSGEKVYGLFKEKEEIEQAFDAMKNELENDKCYLGDSDAVRGYFFVSFLSLYLYFRVLEKIRVAGLTSELSVDELLFQLSKVYIVRHNDGKERMTEVPKKVERLIAELGIKNVLPNS